MIRGFLVFVFLFLLVSTPFVKAQQDDSATVTIARAVVHLVVTTPSGESREGSGVLVSPSGAIFTARHVVEDAAEIRVEIFDSFEVPPIFTYYARIQHISQLDNFDFAIIEVFSDAQGQPLETTTLNIPYIQEWGDSVVVREPIEIVGYLESANGVLHFTSGIVGSIQLQPVGSAVPEQRYNFYQTDAVFGSGDSGGLVINSEGEFVGIPTDWESDGGGYVATILPISTICQIETEACVYRPETPIATSTSSNISNSCIEQEWNYAQPPYERIEVAAIEGCKEVEHYLASLWWASLIDFPTENGIYLIGSGTDNTEIVFVQPSNTIQRIAYKQPMGGHVWRHINFSDTYRLEDAIAHANRLVERTPTLHVYVISLPEALVNTAVQNLITCISPSMYGIPSC